VGEITDCVWWGSLGLLSFRMMAQRGWMVQSRHDYDKPVPTDVVCPGFGQPFGIASSREITLL
jgi:hypothetical protein